MDEDLTYDEQTLIKVRDAIMRAPVMDGDANLDENEANEVIRELQNAGIKFREVRSDG